jgi:hypothetical protein
MAKLRNSRIKSLGADAYDTHRIQHQHDSWQLTLKIKTPASNCKPRSPFQSFFWTFK